MDKTTLVGPDIQEGRRFLDLLRGSGVPVKAALWQKAASNWQAVFGDWSLKIVTPLVEDLGPKETYRRLDRILAKAPERLSIDLLDVSVLTPRSWFYKNLRRYFPRARDLAVTMRPDGDGFSESFIYFVK